MEFNVNIENAVINYQNTKHGTCTTAKKPDETITLEMARAMYHEYNERHKVLSELKHDEEARYGWHSFSFYKNYIAYLEQEAAKHGYQISGIRMYYAAYPNTPPYKDKAGQQTYFFVPTYFNEKHKKHVAFDPLHIGPDGTPMDIHSYLTQNRRNKKKSMALGAGAGTDIDGTDSSVGNMAEMCKPNCGEI